MVNRLLANCSPLARRWATRPAGYLDFVLRTFRNAGGAYLWFGLSSGK
jgi:hypothetical protein